MDINLEKLKTEILAALEVSGMAVFRSHPGALEGLNVISWDTDQWPDFRTFLDVAQKAGAKIVLFASRDFSEEEIEEAREELEETEIDRDERRELERRLKAAQRHLGSTCSLELAFDHNLHLYVYEVQPDWYEDFLDARDEIEAVLTATDESEESGTDGFGGYYSNN